MAQLGEVSRVGGGHVHPNSLANLVTIPAPLQRHCAKCRRPALRNLQYCSTHSGRHSKANNPGRAESRKLARMEWLGLLPLDLLALPVWRGLAGLPTSQRAPMRLALVLAWDKRLSQPLHWAKVQRRALDLGATSGKRQNTAAWYENR